MTSEVRYEIKNFITCYLTWKYWHKKSGLVRTQRTTRNWSWLIWLKMKKLKRFVHRLILQTSDNARSKEMEELVHSSWSTFLSIITSYFTLAWQSNFLQKFLTWSQITFLLSIRRTGSQQIDFKVFFSLLKVYENTL